MKSKCQFSNDLYWEKILDKTQKLFTSHFQRANSEGWSKNVKAQRKTTKFENISLTTLPP